MSRQIQDAYIVAARRTPVAKAPRGAFKNERPDDLLAFTLRSLLKEAPWLAPERVADVIIGCAMPEAEQGINVARVAVLLAGMPDAVPGQTINRFCSSGLQAIALAADKIRLGEADVMIAGGTESMSLIPMMGHRLATNPVIFNDENLAIAYGMGITAEKVAERWEISREQQDGFALQSHTRALKAAAAGHFDSEILPYTTRQHVPDLASGQIREVEREITADEGPRPGSNIETLGRLRTVFRADGSVTAANSSQMSDGAGAVLLVSEAVLKEYSLEPLARFAGFSVAGVEPEVMGIGPIAAIPKVLTQNGVGKEQLDWIELNEAFAAQALAVIKDLDLDPEKVNPLGGAIALGHPLGATGAIRTATLLHGMRREGMKYGMVTMCIGTGMGAAGLFEMM